jgi:hypothetical protein
MNMIWPMPKADKPFPFRAAAKGKCVDFDNLSFVRDSLWKLVYKKTWMAVFGYEFVKIVIQFFLV